MKIIVNDLSFQICMQNEYDAKSSLKKFVKLCLNLEHGKRKCLFTDFEDWEAALNFGYDQYDLAPNRRLRSLLDQLNADERRFLLGTLLNTSVYEGPDMECFYVGEYASLSCAKAKRENGAVVSLLSSPMFGGEILQGLFQKCECSIENFSQDCHIDTHQIRLGRRIYHANSGKHKLSRPVTYGDGLVASVMDLDDEQAQNLLNRAIKIDGRLYARKDQCNYAFQNEANNIYHGYKADDLQEKIVRKLQQRFGD